MSAILNRLRRAHARVATIAEERCCSTLHLTDDKADALIWELIEATGGPRALIELARARGYPDLAEFLLRFVMLCSPPAATIRPPRPAALWYADVFNLPHGGLLYERLTDADLKALVDSWTEPAAPPPDPVPRPDARFDLAHLSEAEQDARIWRGIALMGGPEEVQRLFRERGAADLADGLDAVLATMPRPDARDGDTREAWILDLFAYDPDALERSNKRNHRMRRSGSSPVSIEPVTRTTLRRP